MSSTPLHDAARSSNMEEVESLLTSGTLINDTDKLQRTALHLAAWNGDAAMIQLLLRFKADPTLLAQDGYTALHFAAQKVTGDKSCKNVYTRASRWFTFIFLLSGALACEYLVKKSAKILHAKIKKGGKTALHLAVSKGHVEVVRKLLELGADPKTKTGTNQSCHDLCQASE